MNRLLVSVVIATTLLVGACGSSDEARSVDEGATTGAIDRIQGVSIDELRGADRADDLVLRDLGDLFIETDEAGRRLDTGSIVQAWLDHADVDAPFLQSFAADQEADLDRSDDLRLLSLGWGVLIDPQVIPGLEQVLDGEASFDSIERWFDGRPDEEVALRALEINIQIRQNDS